MSSSHNLVFLITVFAGSYLLSRSVINYALKANMVDVAGHRSSHQGTTPRGGGLAIVIMSLLAGAYLMWLGTLHPALYLLLFAPAGLVALVSFIDDHRHLPKGLRLGLHIIGVSLFLVLSPGLPEISFGNWQQHLGAWWMLPIVFVCMIWLLNLYNFMDGIDGIASVQALMYLAGLNGLIWLQTGQLDLLNLAICAAIGGFLCLNWHPAKLFMGDIGACFLGLLLPCLGLYYALSYQISLWAPLILLAVFIVDATWTLITRMSSGQAWSEPHRSHAYQILSRKWHSHSLVVCAMLTLIAAWLLPLAFLADHYPNWGLALFGLACLPLLTICHIFGAGRLTEL
ncbi:MAG: glycosyltransferase family 4 protein [Cellvibrionaceae bacterium]|nr:glycosyltransferase family 4 protein [Cellvibrionaceae bacterium]MCV6625512.1 glycosyltransferase family 4 protein [Cellvibrionaceae bacterium]